MFTGIIEATGTIAEISSEGTNKSFWIASPITHELKVDQSITHDGVCLTIEEIRQNSHKVTAIDETLKKTSLHTWHKGKEVNLERSMQMNGRLDGHIVQGHVDAAAKCIEVKNVNGSHEFTFKFPEEFAALVIEKGSISINGISLTIFNVTKNTFTVAIIPYTFVNTNMKHLQTDQIVNIEFDIIGKYVNRISKLKSL